MSPKRKYSSDASPGRKSFSPSTPKSSTSPNRKSFSPAVKRASDNSSSPLAKKLSMSPPVANKFKNTQAGIHTSKPNTPPISKKGSTNASSSGSKKWDRVLASESTDSNATKRPLGSPQPLKKEEKPASLSTKCPDFTSSNDEKPPKAGNEQEQKRQLVRAIKKFYNALDISSIDRSKVKIRRKLSFNLANLVYRKGGSSKFEH